MYTKKHRLTINVVGGIYRKIVLNFVQTSNLHKCATQRSKPIISHGTVETLSSKAK